MASASEKVFDTVELLEMILLKLPAWANTLLLSQRVSKHWKVVIEGSNKIQEALFFKPINCGGQPLQYCLEGTDGYTLKTHDGRLSALSKVFVNPLTLPYLLDPDDEYDIPPLDQLPMPWRRREASWRKMIGMQPSMSAEMFEMPGRGEGRETHFETGETTLATLQWFLNKSEDPIREEGYDIIWRYITLKCNCQGCKYRGGVSLSDTFFAIPLQNHQQLEDLKIKLNAIQT